MYTVTVTVAARFSPPSARRCCFHRPSGKVKMTIKLTFLKELGALGAPSVASHSVYTATATGSGGSDVQTDGGGGAGGGGGEKAAEQDLSGEN